MKLLKIETQESLPGLDISKLVNATAAKLRLLVIIMLGLYHEVDVDASTGVVVIVMIPV